MKLRHRISERDHQSPGAKMNVQTQTECQRDAAKVREIRTDRDTKRISERVRAAQNVRES